MSPYDLNIGSTVDMHPESPIETNYMRPSHRYSHYNRSPRMNFVISAFSSIFRELPPPLLYLVFRLGEAQREARR